MKTDNTNTPVSVKQSPTSGEQNETIVTDTNNENKEPIKLCENMDCERYPDDWDSEEDTEDTYQEGQWKKCCLCDGYFDDDGMGDILYVQEEPNNQEAECSLCGKTENIVQMKGSGQYLCGNACDEEEEEEDEDEEEEEEEEEVDPEKEDINAFECVDCNFNGINCYEEIGFTKSEFDIYIELGEPDRCESCFDKWKESSDAYEYLKKIKEEEEESEKESKTEDSECDNNIEECKTMCNNSNANKLTCRKHFSNMMFSHICMIIPCIWWIRIDNPETMNAVLYSKLMSMVMIVAIIASYTYHYYNECVLCSAETEYNKFAILCLNIYMYLRNVSIFYIVLGFTILYALHRSLEYSNSQNKDFYEIYHPFCHYIAGLYIYYCVWNLEHAQQNVCDITTNSVIYNDIYSGVNYHEIRI
jgi:hypothetical protein